MNRKLSASEEAEIITHYNNGEAKSNIGVLFHRHTLTIQKVLLKHNTPLRPVRGTALTVNHKVCTNCNRDLPLDLFSRAAGNKGKGFKASWCRDCSGLLRQRWARRNPQRVWAANALWCHSNRYGFEVNITLDFLTSLAEQTKSCALCGDPLDWTVGDGFSWLSPTLDRMDNSKVLNKDNVWIIHHRCNAAKGQQPKEEFIKWVKRIASRFD